MEVVVASRGDHRAPRDPLPDLDVDLAQIGIRRAQTTAMVNRDSEVLDNQTGPGDPPRFGRMDWCTHIGVEVDSPMTRKSPVGSEPGGDGAIDRVIECDASPRRR